MSSKVLAIGAAISVVSVGSITSSYINSEYGKKNWLFRVVEETKGSKGSKGRLYDGDGKHFRDFSVVPVSYIELINGTTRYNSGNYVIYYGSQACPHCTDFLYGDHSISGGSFSLKRDKMSEGAWMKAYDFTRSDPDLKKLDIKFIMFEDVPTITKESSDVYWSLPWASWTANDLSKGQINGEYKRNDPSAIEFRKVFSAAIERFGNDKVGGTPTIITYRNGQPMVFGKDKLPGLEDKDTLSKSLSFNRWLKYFYTRLELHS